MLFLRDPRRRCYCQPARKKIECRRRFPCFAFSLAPFRPSYQPPLLCSDTSSSPASIIKYNTGLGVSQIIVARPRRDTLRLACQLDTVYEVTKYARSLHRVRPTPPRRRIISDRWAKSTGRADLHSGTRTRPLPDALLVRWSVRISAIKIEPRWMATIFLAATCFGPLK